MVLGHGSGQLLFSFQPTTLFGFCTRIGGFDVKIWGHVSSNLFEHGEPVWCGFASEERTLVCGSEDLDFNPVVRPCHLISLGWLPPLKSDGWVGNSQSGWNEPPQRCSGARSSVFCRSHSIHHGVKRVSETGPAHKPNHQRHIPARSSEGAPPAPSQGGGPLRHPQHSCSHSFISQVDEWSPPQELCRAAPSQSFPFKHRTWFKDTPSNGSFLSPPHPLIVLETQESWTLHN